MDNKTNNIQSEIQIENDDIEFYYDNYKNEKRMLYIQNILTKTKEAQDRVDRLTIMMYQRFINETEDWDN